MACVAARSFAWGDPGPDGGALRHSGPSSSCPLPLGLGRRCSTGKSTGSCGNVVWWCRWSATRTRWFGTARIQSPWRPSAPASRRPWAPPWDRASSRRAWAPRRSCPAAWTAPACRTTRWTKRTAKRRPLACVRTRAPPPRLLPRAGDREAPEGRVTLSSSAVSCGATEQNPLARQGSCAPDGGKGNAVLDWAAHRCRMCGRAGACPAAGFLNGQCHTHTRERRDRSMNFALAIPPTPNDALHQHAITCNISGSMHDTASFSPGNEEGAAFRLGPVGAADRPIIRVIPALPARIGIARPMAHHGGKDQDQSLQSRLVGVE